MANDVVSNDEKQQPSNEVGKTKRWHFDKSLNIGDFSTALTILISLAVLFYNSNNDIQLRQREQANLIRTAAAKALTNLETLQSLQLSLFEDLQPVYVDVSQQLYTKLKVMDARDYLWLTITQKMAGINETIVEKEIVIGYADLLVDFPGIRNLYLNSLDAMKALTTITAQTSTLSTTLSIYDQFLGETEKAVLNFPNDKPNYQSPMLGNDLRNTSETYRKQLEIATKLQIEPMRTCIFKLIEESDSALLANPTCP